MQTIIAAMVAAILLVALGSRDLFVRKLPPGFTHLFQVSAWSLALVLFVLIWINPEHGATDPQLFKIRTR